MLSRRSPGVVIGTALLLAAIGHVVWLFSLTDRGFDLTDESFNTLIAMFPGSQLGQVTLTGYLTTFLWQLSGHSIPAFRLLGMAIFLACVLGMAASAFVFTRTMRLGATRTAALCLGAAAVGAMPYFYKDFYTVGPSYNWLAMIGLLGIQAGFFLLVSGRSATTAGLAMGVGGFLAFAGKPTSGVGILVLVVLLFSFMEQRRHYLRVTGLAALVAIGLGLACSVGLGGGLMETYGKFAFALEYVRLVQSNHTIPDSLQALAQTLLVTPWKVFLFTQKFTIVLIAATTFASWRLRWRSKYALAAILLAAGVELSFHDISHGSFNFYLVSSFLLTLIAGTLAFRFLAPQPQEVVSFRSVFIPLLLGLSVAISHVFGTNTAPSNKLLLPVVSVVVPMVLIGLWVEQRARQSGVALVIAFFAVFSGAVLLHRSAELPFRMEGGLAAQTVPVTFLNQSGAIRLDPVKAAYARAILQAANAGGWVPGTPLINLTGHTPGVNVILDAPFVGLALLINGPKYPGGQEALGLVVARIPATMASQAWVFTSRNGNLRLDPRVLRSKDGAFPCGYRLVGEFPSYTEDKYTDGQPEIHELWRPMAGSGMCSGRASDEATS